MYGKAANYAGFFTAEAIGATGVKVSAIASDAVGLYVRGGTAGVGIAIVATSGNYGVQGLAAYTGGYFEATSALGIGAYVSAPTTGIWVKNTICYDVGATISPDNGGWVSQPAYFVPLIVDTGGGPVTAAMAIYTT